MFSGCPGSMRTTLTLDDDVAMLLKRFSEEARLTFRDAVNGSIRHGLFRKALREAVEIPQQQSEAVA